MKIAILDAKTLGELDFSKLNEFGEYTVYQTTNNDERLEHIGNANVIITNKVIIDKNILDACSSLKLICITATGMNNVDLEYAAQKNVVVKNVAGYSTESVAQHTFSMLLHLLHSNRYYDNYTRSGEYTFSDTFCHMGPRFSELKGKRWGIIGLGNIGKRVAEIAKVFGCEVVYYSTSGKNNSADILRLELQELLTTADVVSIHAPLNDNTLNLIGEEELSYMKSSAYLINVGRGGIVDEKELAIALDSDLIGGACVDVLTKEPIEAMNPLLHIEKKHKLFITPHTAWTSIEAVETLWEMTLQNIRDEVK